MPANKTLGVDDHIWFKGGAKTICTSHVLGFFHIDPASYHYSGTVAQRSAILRKFGFAVRSRNSAFKKCTTVGTLRSAIIKYKGDPAPVKYMVRVRCSGTTHAILLDSDGTTLVDTAPRKRDRRQVLDVRAVFPNGS